MPTFLFKGQDLLATIKDDLKKLRHDEYDESPMPPRKLMSEDAEGLSVNDSFIDGI